MEEETSNFKGTFMRNLIVAVQGALYELISIDQLTNGNESEQIALPFYYSLTGSEQFIKDYFLDTDRYCTELNTKIEGVVNKLPRAIITPSGNVSIKTNEMLGGRVRIKHFASVESDFGKEVRELNSRGEFLPVAFTFEGTIKASNTGQMFKILDAMWDSYIWKGRRFYMDFRGIRKIPCTIKLPDAFNMEKSLKFGYGEEKKPELSFSLEVSAYRPVIDKRTTFDNGNRITDAQVNIKLQEKGQGDTNPV